MRAASAMVLAPTALAVAVIGGLPFVLLWCAAGMVIFWEWSGVVAPRLGYVLAAGLATLAATGALIALGAFGIAAAAALLGAAIIALFAPGGRKLWAAAGVPYAAIAIVAPAVLRADPDFGLIAIVFLFGVVWMTDIFGYFVGRWIGGPKLWRSVSPSKTWSGAAGGLLGAFSVGVAAGSIAGLPHFVTALLGITLSIFAQLGDLTESAVKRRFGVKDASHLIPGHGGLMDRLDGFLAAALVAAVVGVTRGGVGGAARGLLIW